LKYGRRPCILAVDEGMNEPWLLLVAREVNCLFPLILLYNL